MSNSWQRAGTDTYISDDAPLDFALSRSTHLAIGAHQDDLEIMAIHGILECYRQKARSFTGVVATDGAGSARSGRFLSLSHQEMQKLRKQEQRAAARLGEYGALVQLNYPSAQVKDARSRPALVSDLVQLLEVAQPNSVYTHSLSDAHGTHLAVSLAVIFAVRALAHKWRPKLLVGCEVWQDLDWLSQDDKVVMDVSERGELQTQLLSCFESQVAGGKRYDLAAMGRRRAHATFSESHAVDQASGLVYGMNLLPLLDDPLLNPSEYLSFLAERSRRLWVEKLNYIMS